MSSMLLEILGRAVNVNTADLIQYWFEVTMHNNQELWETKYQELSKVIRLASDRKFEKAREYLRFYLFENPTCSKGRLAAGELCLYENELEDAIEQFNSVYYRDPTNTMALYALGHCYERLGKEGEAIAFYQDCLKFKNYLQLPRQRMAAIYYKNSQIEKTTIEYEELKREFPDDVSVLVTLGYLYMLHCRNDKAVDAFNSAILMHPDNFQSEPSEVDELIFNQQYEEAMDAIDLQLAEDPSRIDLILREGDIYEMQGQTNEAIEKYQQALKVKPDFLEATIKLGTSYLKSGQKELAAIEYNNAMEINDRIVDSYLGLATAQQKTGKISEAKSTMSLASAIVPNSSVLFMETAKLQYKLSHGYSSDGYEKSKEKEDDLIEIVIRSHKQDASERPENADIYYRLGILMMGVERNSEAIKYFQKVLEINPMHVRARFKLSICLYNAGKDDESLAELPDPEECLSKDTLELHYKTALLYCNKVKFASSILNLEKSAEDNLTNCNAVDNISIVLQNLGLLNRASAMWENLQGTMQIVLKDKFNHHRPRQF